MSKKVYIEGYKGAKGFKRKGIFMAVNMWILLRHLPGDCCVVCGIHCFDFEAVCLPYCQPAISSHNIVLVFAIAIYYCSCCSFVSNLNHGLALEVKTLWKFMLQERVSLLP